MEEIFFWILSSTKENSRSPCLRGSRQADSPFPPAPFVISPYKTKRRSKPGSDRRRACARQGGKESGRRIPPARVERVLRSTSKAEGPGASATAGTVSPKHRTWGASPRLRFLTEQIARHVQRQDCPMFRAARGTSAADLRHAAGDSATCRSTCSAICSASDTHELSETPRYELPARSNPGWACSSVSMRRMRAR